MDLNLCPGKQDSGSLRRMVDMAAYLTYVIFTGRLVGFANGRSFNIHALSGGGGGSRNPDNPDVLYDPGVINNPYMTGQRTMPGERRGGPIPPGSYKINSPAKHKHLGLSAQLTPRSTASMAGRGGFYIHGRGPRGSDGCIVPMDKFQELMSALGKESSEEEGICGYLSVVEDDYGWVFV